jgi:hypothetical protein
LFVDASGNVGIGTSAPLDRLHIASTGECKLIIGNEQTNTDGIKRSAIIKKADNDLEIRVTESAVAAATIFTRTASIEAVRIDSSGRLLVGTSSNIGGGIAQFGTIAGTAATTVQVYASNASSDLRLNRSNANAIVLNDQELGKLTFEGHDGSVFSSAAQISASVDGAPGSADMPGRLVFSTTADGAASPTERLRITSAGNVGIGTTSPGVNLEIAGTTPAIRLTETASTGFSQIYVESAVLNIDVDPTAAAASSAVRFNVDNSERARIDSSGRLLVGTSSALGSVGAGAGSLLQIANGNQVIGQYSANLNGGFLELTKSRNATAGSHTVVQSGDQLGIIRFSGSDGSSFVAGAQILCSADGTPGTNDMPGRLVFSTTADGAATPTERLRITSAGVLQVADAGNIQVGTTTGTKIGTATTQKIGFFDKTPVVQPAAVADATTAVDVITQLNDLLAKLRTLGIIAT